MEKQDSTSDALTDALAPISDAAAAEVLLCHPELDRATMLPLLAKVALDHGHRHYRDIMDEWLRVPERGGFDAFMRKALVDFLDVNLCLDAKKKGIRVGGRASLDIVEPLFTPARVEAALTHDRVLHEIVGRVVSSVVGATANAVARRFGIGHLAEDLAQNAIIYLYAVGGPRSKAPGVSAYKLRAWDPAQGKTFRDYVGFIARRAILGELRRRLGVPRCSSDEGVEACVYDSAPLASASVDLKAVMGSLTVEDWKLVQLVLQGYSSREISEILGWASDAAVNVRKCRLRKELRKLFPGLVMWDKKGCKS